MSREGRTRAVEGLTAWTRVRKEPPLAVRREICDKKDCRTSFETSSKMMEEVLRTGKKERSCCSSISLTYDSGPCKWCDARAGRPDATALLSASES